MLELKFNILLCASILSLLCLAPVESVCVLQYPDDIENAPIYTKYFGRYAFELPYTRSDIILQNGEIIYAECRTIFHSIPKRRDYYYDLHDTINMEHQTHIKLQCVENSLHFGNVILDDNVLKCKKLNWSVYEDNKTKNWCKIDAGLVALLLATKSSFTHHVLAEICFDLNDWSLQTITYNVSVPSENVEMMRDIVKTKLQTVDLLGENLWNLKSTNNFDLTDLDLEIQLKEMSQHNSWLHLANYELSPIVQGKSYENYFKEYSNILNTIWWSNLRLGNWKRFIDTIENYAKNNSFQLYTGTSGVVRKPIYNNADLSKDLTIKFGFKKKPIPAYIWTFVISTDKTNMDFIIIGYNSPYAEFFSRSEIVFCPDICDEIPWLNKISESFKFNTAGIMFCCSPESVKQTNTLNGFPMEILKSLETLVENSTISSYTTSTSTERMHWNTTTVAYNEIRSQELIYNDLEDENFDERYNDDY